MKSKYNWQWNEKMIQEAIMSFKEFLKTNKAKKIMNTLIERREIVKKYLTNEEAVNRLTNEKIIEVLKQTFAARGNKSAITKINEGNAEYAIEVKKWFKDLINYDGEKPIPTIENLKVAFASQLLTMLFPYKFYIVNESTIEGIKNLGLGELPENKPENYPQWRPFFEYLKERINKVIQEDLGRPVDFYDVDQFLWYIYKNFPSQSKTKENEKKLSEFNEKAKELEITIETKLIEYFISKGYRFKESQICAFYSALKTKGFVILSGLSGTGKTKLAQLFAELLCPCKKCHNEEKANLLCECNHLFFPVRPDWRDGKPLLGYYNPLTEKYESTHFLQFILKAKKDYENSKDKANPFFIILDEMNLSHVEYYFADFLSVLESGRDENGFTKEAIKLHSFNKLKDQNDNEIPSEIKLPPNLYIIGTVNIDETTYMFSPKVLDRAFTLEFREVDFERYRNGFNQEDIHENELNELRTKLLESLRNNGKFCGVIADKEEVRGAINNLKEQDKLVELNNLLQPYDLHFGYRVLNEIALFVKYATNAPGVVGKLEEKTALDYAVLMKVLPKFYGPRQKLEKPLRVILKWTSSDRAPDWVKDPQKSASLNNILEEINTIKTNEHFKYSNTAKKVLIMLRQLYEFGFASFAQ